MGCKAMEKGQDTRPSRLIELPNPETPRSRPREEETTGQVPAGQMWARPPGMAVFLVPFGSGLSKLRHGCHQISSKLMPTGILRLGLKCI